MPNQTTVSIAGDDFLVNGQLTYPGRTWRGRRIEGLLLNSRMVQATFDDLNPVTQPGWAYPESGVWDAERNTNEFLAMLPEYRRHGLLAVTLNLQGGNPEGYGRLQPWLNSGFTPEGELRLEYLDRLRRILERMDALGMVAILGLFYFGQDEHLRDEAAVRRGVDNAVQWLLGGGYGNVIVEIANECDVPRYEHAIMQPERIHELIEQVRTTRLEGRRLLVGTSYKGRAIPGERVLAASDLALLHGNGVSDPATITAMVRSTRALTASRPLPIVFNEDDHFDFEQPVNNFLAATDEHASWGYFDPGPAAGGGAFHSDYTEGFQNVPVNWRLNTERKRGFFALVQEITGR